MADVLPIWIRLPQPKKDSDGNVIEPARCPFTGLSTAKLFRLAVPCRENDFAPLVLSVSIEEGSYHAASQSETVQSSKKRKGRFVRLIRLRGPSPHPKRLALLDYLDNLALQGANAEGEE